MTSLALKYIYTKDQFERSLIGTLAEKAADSYQKLQHNLAVEISNEVGRLFK